MKNKEYVANLIDEIGEKNGEIIMDMVTLQKINAMFEDIGNEYLRKKLEESFFKIGEDYGNQEIDVFSEASKQ